MNQLDNQLNRLESNLVTNDITNNVDDSSKAKTKNPIEKFSSIPSMLKCDLCEDFCEDAVQIVCCYENFCDKHIKEEIMKNFTCPNCKSAATMRDIVPNKKLRENITWFKSMVSEIHIQNLNKQHGLDNVNQSMTTTALQFSSIGEKVTTLSASVQPQIEYKPIGSLDNIAESKEKDMTPEEKMQLYDKHNENLSIVEQTGVRKLTEEKLESESKSVKETSSIPIQEKPANNPIIPTNPFMQMPPYMPMGINPMKPDVAGIPTNPSSMMYYNRMDPRMYYQMMSAGYPYPMGMYPMGMQPQTEEKSKVKKSHKSRSASSSRSNSKRDRHKKKRKSRSRSRSHGRDGKTKGRDRDKDRDRDRERNKEREREKQRERDKEKSRTKRKHK